MIGLLCSIAARRAMPAWRKFRDFSRRTKYALLAALVLGSMLPILLSTQNVSASSMGPYSPTAGTSVAGSGTTWTNPTNVKTADSAYATVSLAAGGTSYFLEATGYGFTIPTQAIINGIQVSVTRYGSNASIQDNVVQILQTNTTPVGTNKAVATGWPTSNASTSYGSTSDLWGLSWTPAQIDASTFGVALSAKNTCAILCTYTANVDYISITVNYTPLSTYNQASYRWMQNSNVQPYPISEYISSSVSGHDVANSVAVDHGGGYMYMAGYDSNASSPNDEWRIEKRSLSTGALSYGISEHISTSNDIANAIAIDPTGGYMYVAGYDENTTGNINEWRIEKRNLSDGSLVTSFGTGGGISEHISTKNDIANAIAIDPTGGYMYVAGYDANTTGNYDEWRIEKRSFSSGALSYGVSEHISSNYDDANAIAIDPTGGYMYVAGYDSNASSDEWRIEKRSLSSGALSYGLSEVISGYSDIANAIAIDPTGGYMYVAGYDANNSSVLNEWRIEKRNLSDGSLVTSFGTGGGISEHISTSNDIANAIAIDPTGGYMYVAGYDQNTSGNYDEWRIEARNLTNGSTMPYSTNPLAAANTTITTPTGAFRLRILLGINGAALTSKGQNFQLAEAQMTSGTCATQTYSTIASSTSPIAYYNNSNIPDGNPVGLSSNDPTDGSNTIVAQNYLSSNTYFTNGQSAIGVGQDGEWDISLYNYSAAPGTTWCFEVQKSGGGALDTYTSFPQLTTSAISFTQAGYLWSKNINKVQNLYPVSEHISKYYDDANAIAIDPTGGYMYVAGYDSNASGNYEWRIEKRSLSTGALSYGISEHISTSNDIANAIAIDPTGGYMYVAGYDENTTGNYNEWRIEKRNLSDGSLVTSFGTGGGISEHVSTFYDDANNIAIDPTGGYMYVAGYDANTTNNRYEWRIEKRNLSTGALSYGVSEHISSTNNDYANAISIDPTGGYMYVVGSDESVGANADEWRIEKRNLSTGALSYGVSEHISNANDATESIAIDPSGGYMYVAGSDQNTSGNYAEWRIEKRNLSTGALSYGTSEHISNANDATESIAIDPSGGYMYVAGLDSNTSGNNNEWRIEKRNLSTGALSNGVSEHISTKNDYAKAISIDPTGGYMYVAGYDQNTTGNYDEWRIESRNLTDDSMNSITVNPLMPANTSTTQFHPGDIVRLRIIIGVGGSSITSSGQAFKLQVANSNGSCSNSLSYNDVTFNSGGVRFFTGNTNLADGSSIMTSISDPADGNNTIVAQDYLSSNTNFTNNQSALRPTQDGEWDIALQVAATNIGGFCFRVVKSSGSLLDTYNNFPSLGVHALPNQRLYHGKQLVTGSLSGLDTLIP